MAEERNVLIFEIKKVGVDAANKALKEYVKLSKEADAVKNKSSDGGKTPFTKAASEAGQYGSALEKLNSIQKTSMSIEEKLAGVKASYISKIHEYNAAIKKGVGVAESQLIQSQKHNEHLKGQVARIDNVRSAEILLQNTFKAGLQVFQEHSDAITLMNQRIDSLNPGVKRLTEVWHAKTANELLGAKATREADMAIGMLEKTLKGTTDALKRQEIQEKIAILTQKKATAGVLQNVQAQKLWRDQEASKTRIITQANDVLKKYNLTLRTMDKELKVAKDGVAKLTVMFRQENSIIDGASSVLATYDKRLIKVRTAISKSTDALKTEALALREKALVEARGNTVLAKRTALMKLANTKEKQSELLLKDASVAIVTYNDKIKKLVKSIQDEHNVIKKVTTANKALRQARIEGANLAKYYATELDKVEKELKQNMSAEKRLAVEMRQRALQEAKLNAGVASTSGLLKIKRMRLDALSKSFNTASQAMRRFGRIMIRYVTTTMVAALAQGVRFAANIEAQTVRFGVLTGSLEKGSRLFQEIIAFSAKTPFLLPQLDQAAQVLLAFGSPLKDVMNELRMLGDVAQGDAQKLERIATSFGKVRARGTAHMRELNRFIMSGVPIISELNKQFGLTGNTLFTMIQKNQISFDNINKAFKSMTAEGGKFYKMTENVAKTLEGRFSTAVDNMNLNLARLVEDFTPKLKRLLEQFIDWSQAFRTLDKDARKALVTTMAITAAIGPASIAIAGAVKLIGNAMAGNWAGVVIAGIALIASFVGWAVLSKKMGDISAKALALKESTEKLAKAQGFQTNMIPGLTEEMYDLAKAYDAYGMAMAQANERVAIKKKIDSGDVLTTQLRGAFNLIRDMEDFNITVGINYKWYDFNAKGYLAGSLKKYLGELQETIPESETIISQAISEVLGTNRSLESLSTSDLEMFTIADWKALGAKLSTIVGKDLDEFKGIIEKNLKARFDYIGTDAWMRELLGISPEDALNDWGLAVSEGLSKITGDVDTGLIDLASGISRTQQLLTSLPEMLKATIKGLRSGEIKESVWKTDFVGALSIEDAVYQAKQATEKAVTDYSNYLRDIFSMRLFQIQDESMIDNYISSILGITDEKDIKKQLQTQLDGYADEFKNIGLTTQELMVLDTGGKLENELKQDLVDKVMASAKVANDELKTLLKAEEKIDLFKAFFDNDIDSFINNMQIDALAEELYKELSSMDFVNADPLSEGFAEAITMGFENMDLTSAQQKLVDRIDTLYKEAQFDTNALFENIFGTSKDWDTYLDEIAYEATLQDFKTQFMKVSRMLQISPLTLMTSIKTEGGVDVESLLKNNPVLTVDTEGTAEIGNTLGAFVLEAGDVIANASIEAGNTIATAIMTAVNGTQKTSNYAVDESKMIQVAGAGDMAWLPDYFAEGNNSTSDISLDTLFPTDVLDEEVTTAIEEAMGGTSTFLSKVVDKVVSFFLGIKNKVEALDLSSFDIDKQLAEQGDGLFSDWSAWSIGYRDNFFKKIKDFFLGIKTKLESMKITEADISLDTMIPTDVSEKELTTAIDEAMGGTSAVLSKVVDKVITFFSGIETEVEDIDLSGFDIDKQLAEQGDGLFSDWSAWSIGYRDDFFKKIKDFFLGARTVVEDIDLSGYDTVSDEELTTAIDEAMGGISVPDGILAFITASYEKISGINKRLENTATAVDSIDTIALDNQVEMLGATSTKLYDAMQVAMDSAVIASDGSLGFVEDVGLLFGTMGDDVLELRQKTLDVLTSSAQLLADAIKAVELATGIDLGMTALDFSGINITDIDFADKINTLLEEVNTGFTTLSVKISEMDEEKQQLAYTALAGFVDQYNAIMTQISELQNEFPDVVKVPMAGALPATETTALAEIATSMGDLLSPSITPLITAIEENTAALLGNGTGGGGATVTPLTPEQILEQLAIAEDLLLQSRVATLGDFGKGAYEWLEKLNVSEKEALAGAELLQGVYEDIGQVLAQSLTPALEEMGQAWAEGNGGLGDSLSSVMSAMTDALPGLLINAGLRGLIDSGWTNPVAWSMLAVGGIGAIISGAVSGAGGETPITGGASTIGLAKGGIVNSPQLAMIGEGGEPEAVVPLSRANDFGFGGGNVNIVVNNNSNVEVETQETTGADGSRQIEFMIYDTMKKGMNSGELDSSMGSNFGISRQGRR